MALAATGLRLPITFVRGQRGLSSSYDLSRARSNQSPALLSAVWLGGAIFRVVLAGSLSSLLESARFSVRLALDIAMRRDSGVGGTMQRGRQHAKGHKPIREDRGPPRTEQGCGLA